MENQEIFKQFSILSQVDYTIFHGPTFASYRTQLHHEIFSTWKNFWEKHFEETQSSAKLFSDELLRSTYVMTLHQDQRPIGILLCSQWNLWNTVHHHSRYLSQYPVAAKEEFNRLNFKRVLSLEYLSIHPDWCFRKSQLPISEILLGLGLRMFYHCEEIDGVISIARRIVKVQDRMAAWGMREVTNMVLHNNPCTITTCSRNDYRVQNPNATITLLTNHFWAKQTRLGFPQYEKAESSDPNRSPKAA